MFDRRGAASRRGARSNLQSHGATRRKALLLAATACASGLAVAGPVQAQDTRIGEIIVTARKRQESILNVPVIETAVPQEMLERVQVKDVRDLTRFVPGLAFGTAPGPNGTLVTIRGVGTAALDYGLDQSISLNIDGYTFGQGMAYSAAMFDVGQVEVLKGPQALFYGKSSPGGVISIRTADPTDRFEVIARAGYEFEADAKRGELIVSGPVTDTLGLRLATMYTKEEGYFKNVATPLAGTGARAPTHPRDERKGYIIRGTALWEPTDRFSARFKIHFVHDHWYNAGIAQWVSCPDGTAGTLGIPFLGGGEDCKLDRTARIVYMDPAAFPGGVWYNGTPQLKNDQKYGSLELNYQITPELTLTSLTGYAWLKGRTLFQGSTSSFAGPSIAVQNKIDREEWQQEFRLNSEYSGPLNFTAGVFYQDADIFSQSNIPANTALAPVVGGVTIRLPAVLSNGLNEATIRTYSGFGQVRYQVTPELEIAGGVRYTDEKRHTDAFNAITGVPVPNPLAVNTLHSKNWSPELTVTYRPSDVMTVFGSLKQAYKSGSFNFGTSLRPGLDTSFDDERVRGGEVGLKSRLLDRRLALDLAAYYYKYKGLQVGSSEISPTGVPQSRILNAGEAKVYGFEWAATYRPPIVEGLGLNFSGAWTKAKYLELDNIPCWGGQLISQGCNQLLNPLTGLFTAQNLADTPLPKAPRWQLNYGFDYEVDIPHGMSVVISNSNQYYGSHITFPGNPKVRPDFKRPSYTKVNASIALRGPEERWELALIGNNIFDKITAGHCSSANGQNTTGFGAAGGLISGGTVRGPAGIDEVTCRVEHGREVWLRLTVRPFN